MRQYLAAPAALALLISAPAMAQDHSAHAGHGAQSSAELAAAIAAPGRSEANKARDKYRHPAETLTFFGVQPDHVVVEAAPGGGWYTEILAPYLAAKGTLYAAQPAGRYLEGLKAKVAGDPTAYGKVKLVDFPLASTSVPDGSADVVLTFRNVHNWTTDKDPARAATAFASFYRALKPGGILGVVEHRLPEDRDSALEKSSGYLKRATVVKLAEAAGFKLAAESDINANPKDTADWPNGVWTLPPTLSQGEMDKAKYLAIGESDRMTLKFVKPKG